MANITCIFGNLVQQLDCDAIVNSANPSMLAGSGVCGAIHRAAGKGLEKYGKRFAPLGLGQAVTTPGANLQTRLIIHVHGPKFCSRSKTRLLTFVKSVPESIICALEVSCFEDAIINAVSL